MEPSTMLAQERFNRTYITSTEICQRLEVTRPAIHFRRKAGLLPNSIHIYGQQLLIWERGPIEPYLLKWEESLAAKRGKKA